MKHHAFRYALIWTLLLLLLTACTGGQKPAANDANEQILAQLNDMKQELESAKNELNALKQEGQTVSIDTSTVENAPVATTRPEAVVTEVEVPVEMIIAEHCTLNGEDAVRVEGRTAVHAVADEREGYVFDHWVVNGSEDDTSGPEADFVFDSAAAVVAVYRERRVITTKDCHFTLLDKKGKSVGKSYTEFDFENDYTNPETKETCKGGEISFYIFADIPKGMEVDHWLINGVRYEPPYNDIRKFRVEGQTEATLYEVVFRKAS